MPVVASCGGYNSNGNSVATVNYGPKQVLVYNERLGIFVNSAVGYGGGCQGGGTTTVFNQGTGTNIIPEGQGNDLHFKTFKSGPNIIITSDDNQITIAGSQSVSTTGAGASLINNSGTVLSLKSLINGNNTTIVDNGTDIQVNSMQRFNNIGSGENIAAINGSAIDFKTFTAGTGINITNNSSELIFTATGGKDVISGNNITVVDNGTQFVINSMQEFNNIGNGNSLVSANGNMLDFKTIKAGTGINLADNGNEITINSSGGKDVISGNNTTVVDNGSQFVINTMQSYVNTGNGNSLISTLGSTLNIKTIKAGTGINLADNGNEITINSTQNKPSISGANTTVIDDGNNYVVNSLQAISNIGSGHQIASTNNNTLDFKTFVAGNGVGIIDNGNEITITAFGSGGKEVVSGNNTTVVDNGTQYVINTMQSYVNTGNGNSLISTSGASLNVKTIRTGSGINIIDNGNDIQISSTLKPVISGNNTTVIDNGAQLLVNSFQNYSNLGNGTIIAQTNGNNIEYKSFVAGNGISISDNNGEITLTATSSGGKDVISGNNTTVVDNGTQFVVNSFQNYNHIGNGTQLLSTNGSSMDFKTFIAGSGVSITENNGEITLTATGSSNNILAGNNITVIQNGNNFTINGMQSYNNKGTANTLVSTNGSSMDFKTLKAGNGISFADNGDEIEISFNQGAVQSPSSLVLDNMTQLNNINNPNIGQIAYVTDTGQGEWGMFLYTGSTWLNVANSDSVASDANALVVNFDFNSPTQLYLGRVSQGSVVSLVTIRVNNAFDDSPILSIGTLTDHTLLMDNNIIDLNHTADSVSEPNIQFNGPGETEIYAFFDNGTTTSGNGSITVNYS